MAQVSESGAFAQLSDAREKPLGKPESSSKLLESLDSLLEQYLQLLHRHQTLHAQLGKQLSSVRSSPELVSAIRDISLLNLFEW